MEEDHRPRSRSILSLFPSVGYREVAASKPRKNEETFVLAPRSSSLLGRETDHWSPLSSAKVVCGSVCGSGYKVRRTSRQTRDAFCAGNVVGSVQKRLSEPWRYPEGKHRPHFRGQFSQVRSLNWWRIDVSVEPFHFDGKLWYVLFNRFA